uniref:EF-hand domain-containing protein n=1 Tax=Anopheles funestus TaxID=62324 RepID=A0A4Y0BJ24_ANOFN
MAGPHLEESTVTTPSITAGVMVNTASLSLSRPTNLESSICTIDDFLAHFKHKELENDVSKYLSHKQRPLCRRVLAYLRTAWMGAKFTSKSDCELEEIVSPPKYRPESIAALCEATRFTEAEIKRIYRGFKAECPAGIIREETFKFIYSQFFPQGANTGLYAHYVFNTLDKEHTGILSFENFVQGLSILSRGTLEEKLCWTFSLYDINHDGKITREEMTDIVTAIYELMGARDDGGTDEVNIKSKVDTIFQKMDTNQDGVITIEEFLDCCRKDQLISSSMDYVLERGSNGAGYEDDSDQEPKGDESNENSNESSLQTAILKSDTSNGPTTTTAGSIANRMEPTVTATTTSTGSAKTQIPPPTSGAPTLCLQQQQQQGTTNSISNGTSKGHRTSRTSKQSILVNGRTKTNATARHQNHFHHQHSHPSSHLHHHHPHQPCSTAQQQQQQQQQQQSQQPLLKHYHIPLQDTYHSQQPLQPLHLSTLRLGQGSCYAPPPPPPLPTSKLAPPQTLSLALPPCNGSYLGQLSASSSNSSSHQHHHHHHYHHHLQPSGRIATISSPMSPPGSCCGGGAVTRPNELNCCPIAVDPSQQLRVAPQSDVPTPTLVKVKAWYTVTKQGLTY